MVLIVIVVVMADVNVKIWRILWSSIKVDAGIVVLWISIKSIMCRKVDNLSAPHISSYLITCVLTILYHILFHLDIYCRVSYNHM